MSPGDPFAAASAAGAVELLVPDWPAPPGVRACVSTRHGGVSAGPWQGLNLGSHVGDDPTAVAENRRRLAYAAGLPQPLRWLNQVHGTGVVAVHDLPPDAGPTTADACWTDRPGQPCAVLTADCLPVLFASRDGRVVAAAHAGWRGLAAGVLEATLAALPTPPAEVIAWLGPAIGPDAFEVGAEVRAAFVDAAAEDAQAFGPSPSRAGAWQADLFLLARARLARAGLHAVHGGGVCTVRDAGRFYSHRRDAGTLGSSGRFATLIWRERS